MVSPVGFNPLTTQIARVAWGSGAMFVVITVMAKYPHGVPGSRKVALVLSQAGEQAGGAIIAERTFQLPDGGGYPPRSLYRGVLRFARMPKGTGPAFSVKLTGAGMVTDPLTPPPPAVEYFCGMSTTSQSGSPYYIVDFGGGQRGLFQDVVWSRTDPAGSGHVSWSYQVADVSIADAGKGAYTITGTANSIWKRDGAGHVTDTHLTCDNLDPGGGDPLPPSQRFEGFDSIACDVYPTRGMAVVPVEDWLPVDASGVIEGVNESSIGGKFWQAYIARSTTHVNEDFVPVYDDIPNGDYNFRLAKLFFTALPPPRPGVIFNTPGAYPLDPLTVKYSFGVATFAIAQPAVPPALAVEGFYTMHLTVPPDLLVPAGGPPPTSVVFD